MENKIRNYIYHNDINYTSYDSMKYLFICIFGFLSLVVGTFAIVANLWWGLCILVVLDTTFLLYLIVLRKIKKNYRLRFLSEGIINTLISLLFLSSAIIVLFSTKCDSLGLVYGTLISYLVLATTVIAYTICYSKSNVFLNAHNIPSKKHLLSLGALIPFSGIVGMSIAKIIFKTFNFENQVAVYIFYAIFVVISLLFSFGYSNYIKYYYCIKYKIFCDEFGNSYSPELENKKSKSVQKRVSVLKEKQRKGQPTLKIVIAVVLIPVLILFIIAFVKVMIERY